MAKASRLTNCPGLDGSFDEWEASLKAAQGDKGDVRDAWTVNAMYVGGRGNHSKLQALRGPTAERAAVTG